MTQTLLHHGIFSYVCSGLIYKMKTEKEIEIEKIYKEIDKEYIRKLKK